MKRNRINIYLAVFAFLSNYMFSQVSFVDVNPDSCVCVTDANNSRDTLKSYWDFDNDGSNDFIIESIVWYFDYLHHTNDTKIIPLNNNSVAGDNLNNVFKLNAGDTINNQPYWLSSSGLFLDFFLFQGWHGYWHEPANVFNYAAIRFYSNSTLYHGWVRLNAYADDDSSQVLVTEYAYSTSTITAGEGSTTTSIKKNTNKQSKFSIFPNPNNGSFKLNLQKEIQNGELIIFNSIGQKIHTQKIVQGENFIVTKDLPKGLYSCMIFQAKEQIGSEKLVVE